MCRMRASTDRDANANRIADNDFNCHSVENGYSYTDVDTDIASAYTDLNRHSKTRSKSDFCPIAAVERV